MSTFEFKSLGEVQLFLQLQELAGKELESRAMREISLAKVPWYLRPYHRFRFWLTVRRATKMRVQDINKRLDQLKAPKDEPQPPVDEKAGDGSPFSN